MSSSVSHLSPPQVDPVSHEAILNWIVELQAAMRAVSFAELLDFDGVEALDVLVSPLFVSALYALRSDGPQPRPPARRLVERVRDWAYCRKSGWQQRIAAWRSAAPEPADVVLWTRDITHTVNMQPLAIALRQRGVSCGLLACQAAVFNQLRKQNIDAVYTVGAWPKVVRKAKREGVRRAKQLAACGRWPVPPFEGPLADTLERAVRNTVISQLPSTSEAIANARAALARSACRLLVVGNDLTIEGRAGARVAAALGIPSAVFMHGSISATPLHAMHCADRLLVFGESQRRDLLRLGIADKAIVVCGIPSLDRRPRQTGRIHPLLQSRLGLKSGEPWILVATSGPGHSISHAHHEKVVANLARLSASLPDVPVVVKLHRKDRLENYQRALNDRAGAKLFVVPPNARGFPADIFEWLQGPTMLLTGASSTAIEAMLMDVPVITMDYCNEINGADFIDAGATVHVKTGDALEAAVRKILAGGTPEEVRHRAQNFLKDAFLALDGRAAERGAAVLCDLVRLGKAK